MVKKGTSKVFKKPAKQDDSRQSVRETSHLQDSNVILP